MTMKKVSKERKRVEKELMFYLRYYKELENRGHYQSELDYEIERLIEKLKKMD